jgi:hypothetical protein
MAEIDADAFNAFEAAGWEAKAAGYDHFFGAFTSRLVDPLLDAAEVGPGVRMLDVASGTSPPRPLNVEPQWWASTLPRR